MKLTCNLADNLARIREETGVPADLTFSPVTVCGIPCTLLSCDAMLSSDSLREAVLTPLQQFSADVPDGAALLRSLRKYTLLSPDTQSPADTGTVISLLFSGFAVLLAEGAGTALAFGIQGYPARGISEPSGERNIYGGREGFTEPLRVNLSLIRRRMRSELLCFELHKAGTVSQTEICLCYLRDRAPAALLHEIREKLSSLPLETVLSAGYIRPFLEKSDTQLIHSVGTTQRPDIFCAKILEGRVGILIDGTPFALTVPQLFCETFQTLDDYNYPPAYATLLRWLKYLAALTALLLPAIYTACALYHPELLHETLLQLLTESEQNVPFSLPAEMLGVLFLFEMVREAGLRLPQSIGGAVGMIGGLLVGDAAVKSGLISTPVLTAAAIAATAGFMIPEHHAALTVMRPLLVLLAAAAGLPGIAFGCTVLLYHICGIEVFGYPITAPLAPFHPRQFGDIAMRIGFRRLAKRNYRITASGRLHNVNVTFPKRRLQSRPSEPING